LSNSGLISGAFAEQSSHTGTALTTKGDLHGYSDENTRIPIGSDNFSLLAASGQTLGLKWAASPTSLLTAAGDILYASGANTLARLAKEDNDDVLTLKSGLPSWEAAGGGGGTFVMGRGLAISGDAGYSYYPIYSGSAQYGGTESQHVVNFYFDFTIVRNTMQVIINNMSAQNLDFYFRDDGADVAGVTITAGGTGQFDSGALTTSIASGSTCCSAKDGNGDGSTININSQIYTCTTS